MALLQIDWPGIFSSDAPLVEGLLRGTVISFVLLALLRLTPRRTDGSIGIMDLLVVVLIAEPAGKSMGDYDTLTEGIVLVATLIGWTYILNWLTYAVPAIDRPVSLGPDQHTGHGAAMIATGERTCRSLVYGIRALRVTLPPGRVHVPSMFVGTIVQDRSLQ